MTHQVITVNKKKYAVGLFWQPMAAGFVPRTYARTLAHELDRKLNLFTEYRAMIGLSARRMGHRVGMPSAAAEVIDSLTEYNSFLGVFPVGNFFYLIAVRNGVILVDKLFNSADQAREEYFKLSEIPDWSALFAPGAWGMPRSVERNLSELITGNARATLRPISRTRGNLFSIVLLAIFALLLYRVFQEPIDQILNRPQPVQETNPELADEFQRQIEEKNKELDEQFDIPKAPEPEPLVMPYELLPDMEQRAQTCYQAIALLMQPVSGWVQTTAECGETHANVDFRRSYGTLTDFYNAAANLMPGAYVRERDDNNLNVRVALPTASIQASVDERDADTVLRDVQTMFQAIDASYDAQIVTDTITNGVETATVNIIEIESESKLVPMQFMKIFNDIGGVYMTRCTWNASTRIWNYEVIIYAK